MAEHAPFTADTAMPVFCKRRNPRQRDTNGLLWQYLSKNQALRTFT